MPAAADESGDSRISSRPGQFPEAGSPAFAARAHMVAGKVGKSTLGDDDLLILAAQSLARTYTREERNYR